MPVDPQSGRRDVKMVPARALALVALVLGGAAARAQPPRVVLSEIPTSPTSLVPGAKDPSGQGVTTRFASITSLSVRESGGAWAVVGTTQQPNTSNTVVVLAQGGSPLVIAQEGQLITIGSDIVTTNVPQIPTWDATGRLAFATGVLASGPFGPEYVDIVLTHFGGVSNVVAAPGQPLLGATDLPAIAAGDELVVITQLGAHPFNDGSVGYFTRGMPNAAYKWDNAYVRGQTVFRQSSADLASALPWLRWNLGSSATPDGQHWLGYGEVLTGPTSTAFVIAVDDVIALQEYEPLAGTTETTWVFGRPRLADNGDWYVHGGTLNFKSFAMRSGSVLAWSGDMLASGTESWASFSAVTGLPTGELVLAGTTDDPDPTLRNVLTWNGAEIARGGDGVDVDGDGVANDGAFIAAFKGDQVQVTADRIVHLLATLKDVNEAPLGDALLRIDPCDGFSEYGNGCVGSGGFVPSLSAVGCSLEGSLVSVVLTQGLGGAPATFLIGASAASVPVGGGCFALLNPLPLAITLPLLGSGVGQGARVLSGTLPPALTGNSIYMQAFIADAGSPIGFSSTNGLEIAVH